MIVNFGQSQKYNNLCCFICISQTRSLIGVFEKDAMTLHGYTAELHRCCMRVVNAQVTRSPLDSLNTSLELRQCI